MDHSKGTRSSGRASNFRTPYIRSFVSGSAESTRFQIEEQILSDDADVDLFKLAQFAVKYQLSNNFRVSIWKLLLNVSSCYSEIKQAVALHRKQEAEVLLRSLRVMRSLSSEKFSDVNGETGLDLKSIDVLKMIQLGGGNCSLNLKNQNDINLQAQIAIAKHMLIACEQEWYDAFWLTKNFDELVASVFNDDSIQKVTAETKKKLEAISDNDAVAIMNQKSLWSRIPFPFWFRSVGATMFSHEAVLKLWDKVCSCTKEGLLTLMKVTIETYILEIGSQIVQNFEEEKKDLLEVTITKEAEVALIEIIFGKLSSSRFTARR